MKQRYKIGDIMPNMASHQAQYACTTSQDHRAGETPFRGGLGFG